MTTVEAPEGGSAKGLDDGRTELESVVIRFAGDSGDGMQLTGKQFTLASAIAGNDLATFPDFPAEIRAPAGTLAGVSGFQINFSSLRVLTPGDAPDVLVAMNPAALKSNLHRLKDGGVIICDESAFNKTNLRKAGAATNPLEDGSLDGYQLFKVDITKLNEAAVKDVKGLSTRERNRSRNFFTLGLMYWLYGRPMEKTLAWIQTKFTKQPHFLDSNTRALKAGYHFGDTAGLFKSSYRVPATDFAPGLYRSISGNIALALGVVTCAHKTGKQVFQGAYPITPASDLLHELSKHKGHGVVTFQAEDEIAAVCAAIGASFGGSLGICSTSGPGVALKGEAIGLAMILELPLVIVNVQRGGPSTGLPTKTEQSDLVQALYGRNGEAPLPVIACATPSDCFYMAIEAFRIAIKYMTPVVLLSDGYLANGTEPWRIPTFDDLPDLPVYHPKGPQEFEAGFLPYLRDAETLARPWAIPGTPGLEHRIGGLEKQDKTGNVSYDPENHEFMTRIRAEKVNRVGGDVASSELYGADTGDVVVVGWGGTYGSLRKAVSTVRASGHQVSHLHVRHLFPFPADLEAQLRGFKKVIVAELNMGQLNMVLRSTYLIDTIAINKIQGQPFSQNELVPKIIAALTEVAQ